MLSKTYIQELMEEFEASAPEDSFMDTSRGNDQAFDALADMFGQSNDDDGWEGY